MSALFSVIIPAYNAEFYIERCVQSVLDQTFDDFEVIVVNDGSTDRTRVSIEKINDNRLRIVSQPNRGETAARNTGLSVAVGKYLAFLDADDEWLPNHLETLWTALNNYPEDSFFATGFMRRYFDERGNVEVSVNPEMGDFYRCCDPFSLWTIAQVNNSSNTVIKRSALSTIGSFLEGEVAGGDLDMWIRVAAKYPLVLCAKVTSIYNQTPSTNKPHQSVMRKHSLSCRTAASLVYAGWTNPDVSHKSIRKYIAARAAIELWLHCGRNQWSHLRDVFQASLPKHDLPLLTRLALLAPLWPVFRQINHIRKFLSSRLALRLRGGRFARGPIIFKLTKASRHNSCTIR